MAVICLPKALNTEYLVYMFDSFQEAMDKNIRRIFALLLMESSHGEGDLVDSAAVDAFIATRMRFVRVKVCSV